MIHLNQVLCPVALSNEPDAGLQYAIALAQAHNAKLFVMHCVTDDEPACALSKSEVFEDLKQCLAQSVDIQHGSNARKLDWEPIIVEGRRPSDAITAEAERRQVDLIVMSSRHRSYAAALLGSTAESVSRTAPCPILVTRLIGHKANNIAIKRLLIATDFSADSKMTLDYGFALAQQYQAHVHLLHVLANSPSDREINWESSDAKGPYHEAARRLHESIPAEVHLWSKVTHAVREGKPYREILSYAVEQDIDLICIGAHGKGLSLGTLFGSNANRILRESPCPVLVVRPQKVQKVEILPKERLAA